MDGALVSALAQPAILLVDDDPFMLDLQSALLHEMGYDNVRSTDDPRATLATVLSGTNVPDVIVCDLNMPGMDGVQFLQALSAGGFEGSIILMSGEGARMLHSVQKLLGSGGLTVLGALVKSSPPDSLRALLANWRPKGSPMPSASSLLQITEAEVLDAAAHGQWLLHYQPKISLTTGTLMGVEALVRWNHPVHGVVYPDRFIDIAENCGAIEALTDWVLCEGVDQIGRWTTQGMRLPVAINVSMDNFATPDFATRAARIVSERDASPQDITFEVTESRAMSPSLAPLECLIRLRLLRFKLSIDDFGTGHSSLAQLRDVPFTELKVDRGFVNGACRSQIVRPMLEGSIGLAKKLDMVCVAEGVETAEDFSLLRELGCDHAQGYFIGRPMAPEALPAWLADWRGRQSTLFAR